MPDKGLTEQNTQGKDSGEQDAPLFLKIGDREIECKSPGSGALAMFAKAVAARSGQNKIAGILDFLDRRIVEDEDREWLNDALLNDDIELEDVMDALEAMLEDWSERPTVKSSGSSAPSTRTGSRSTGATRKVG